MFHKLLTNVSLFALCYYNKILEVINFIKRKKLLKQSFGGSNRRLDSSNCLAACQDDISWLEHM